MADVIDAHAELGTELSAADLLRLMDEAHVDRAVVSAAVTDPFPSLRDRSLSLMRALLRSPLRSLGLSRLDRLARGGGLHIGHDFVRVQHVVANDALLDAAANTSGRLIPFAVVTPHTDRTAVRRVEAWIAERRIAGAAAYAWYHALEPGRDLAAIGRLLERAHMPLLLQVGANPRTSDFQALRRACPNLTMILAHAAMPLFQSAWESVRKDPHLFIDLAGPWIDAPVARAAVRAVGAHKAVFASNAPTGLRSPAKSGSGSYAAARANIESLSLRARDMDLIMGGTMAQLLTPIGA